MTSPYVTDPKLLAQLEGDGYVTDPALLAELEGTKAPSRQAMPGRHAESSLYTPERADAYRNKAYNDATSAWKGQVKAAEQGAMLASGVGAEAAGLVTEAGARTRRFFGLGNPDPKAQREQITEALTYQPRTPGAAEGVANAFRPVSNAIGPIVDAIGAEKRRFEGVPIVQDVYAAPFMALEAMTMTGRAPGGALRTAAKEATAANKAADAIKAAGAVAPVAKAAGFQVTPSAVAGSRAVEPRGVKATLEGQAGAARASLANAQKANKTFADELSVKVDGDGRLEPAAFDEARGPAFSVYDEARKFPGGMNGEYTNGVTSSVRGMTLPTDKAVQDAVDGLLMRYATVGDTPTLVEDLKNLRRRAGKRREGDGRSQVAEEAIADVEMAIADQLENELGRRAAAAGDYGFQDRLKIARKDLAQLHEAERATSGGYIDVTKLAERQKKTGRMTGSLQLLAEMGENLPSVFQTPQEAARAVAMAGKPPEASSVTAFINRSVERLGGRKASESAIRRFNEQIPVGPYALDRFGVSPVRNRPRPSPMGPNSGPQQLVGPEKPGPYTPWAGPLSLAPDMPEGFYNGNPSVAPESARLAEAVQLSIKGEPQGQTALQAFDTDSIPWESPGKVSPLRGPSMTLEDQLGPVQPLLSEALAEQSAGIPVPPRGINEAQLSSPVLSPDMPRLPQSVDGLGNNATIQAIFKWLASQRK